jgi:hypothetical protein
MKKSMLNFITVILVLIKRLKKGIASHVQRWIAVSVSIIIMAEMPSIAIASLDPYNEINNDRSIISARGQMQGIAAVPALQNKQSPEEAARKAIEKDNRTDIKTKPTDSTPPLLKLAQELQGNPERIFNWVRSNVIFEPGWGSIQGAEGCRQTLVCNAHDTASLLIALLRASGIQARYVTGVLELTPEFFNSVIGDMPTLSPALTAASVSGWPHQVITDNSGTTHIRVAHVWVEAQLTSDYHPLDAALKPMKFTHPMDLQEITGLNDGDLTAKLASLTQFDSGISTINGLDSVAADALFTSLSNKVLDQLPPPEAMDTPAGEAQLKLVVGALEPVVRPLPVIPLKTSPSNIPLASPPGEIVSIFGRSETLPMGIRHTVTIGFPGIDGTSKAIVPLDTLAGQRLTIDFGAAEDTDIATVAAAGGLWSVPPRQVNLRPVLLLDGTPILTGQSIPFTDFQPVEVNIFRPDGIQPTSARHFLRAGGVGAIVIDPVRVSASALDIETKRVKALRDDIRTIFSQNFTGDKVIGEFLLGHGLSYFSVMDLVSKWTANRLNVRELTARPGEALVSWQPVVTVEGITGGNLQIDVKEAGLMGVSRTGDPRQEAAYGLAVGPLSSGLEDAVFESMLRIESVSATDLISRALRDSLPIRVAEGSSAPTIVSTLNQPQQIKDLVISAASDGFTVFVPQSQQTINSWTGTGWIQIRQDGAFGFLLAGGLHGGAITDPNAQAVNILFDSAKSTGITKLGQSPNFVLQTGANMADFVLTPLGAGLESYQTTSRIYAETGSERKALAGGITSGLVTGGGAILTGVVVGVLVAETAPILLIGGAIVVGATATTVFANELSKAAVNAVPQ